MQLPPGTDPRSQGGSILHVKLAYASVATAARVARLGVRGTKKIVAIAKQMATKFGVSDQWKVVVNFANGILKQSTTNGKVDYDLFVKSANGAFERSYKMNDDASRRDDKWINRLMTQIRAEAVDIPKSEYTRAEWDRQFPHGAVMTPAGIVRVHHDQFHKLQRKGREDLLAAIGPTLTNPSSVVRNKDGSRQYIRVFTRPGEPHGYMSSIVRANAEGVMENVTNHERRKGQIKIALVEGTVILPTALGEQARPPTEAGPHRKSDRYSIDQTGDKVKTQDQKFQSIEDHLNAVADRAVKRHKDVCPRVCQSRQAPALHDIRRSSRPLRRDDKCDQP